MRLSRLLARTSSRSTASAPWMPEAPAAAVAARRNRGGMLSVAAVLEWLFGTPAPVPVPIPVRADRRRARR